MFKLPKKGATFFFWQLEMNCLDCFFVEAMDGDVNCSICKFETFGILCENRWVEDYCLDKGFD